MFRSTQKRMLITAVLLAAAAAPAGAARHPHGATALGAPDALANVVTRGFTYGPSSHGFHASRPVSGKTQAIDALRLDQAVHAMSVAVEPVERSFGLRGSGRFQRHAPEPFTVKAVSFAIGADLIDAAQARRPGRHHPG